MDYIHTLRPLIGHRKIILNAASVIIQRDGKVLLQRRSDNGEWGLIGGLLEINETYEEAALREVREETGLEVRLDSFLGIFHNHNMVWSSGDQAHVITAFFTASIISGDPRIDEESLELRFFGLEEMPPLQSAEEMKNILRAQQKRHPLMNEEDVGKLAFQGMLGVGHMVSSEGKALERIQAEMSGLEPDEDEPLTERVSPQWFRLNLRAVKAKGLAEADIAHMLCQSAKRKPLAFTRQNVFNFCVKLDGSERMKAAAQRVLDEEWLPSHSDQYRAAYHPAYVVLHKDFRRFRRIEDE